MTILHGEKYIVETLAQFIERCPVFDKIDAIESCPNSDEMVSEYNEIYGDIDGEITEVSEMHQDNIDEYFGELDEYNTITTLLENNDDDWVHLYDGTVHTIVRVYDGI